MNYFIDAFKNCTDFKGKATRTEYWMYILFVIIFGILASIISMMLLPIMPLITLILIMAYSFCTNMVGVSMAVKRMNDIGKSPAIVVVRLFLPIAVLLINIAVFYTLNLEWLQSVSSFETYDMMLEYMYTAKSNSAALFSMLLSVSVFAFRIYYFVLLCLPSVETSDVQTKRLEEKSAE